jgi:DNA polymerase-4
MRFFLHIDMDAFFASVEQALNPALKGKPVIVGGVNGRGVVTSASYEARKYGVHSAMPGFQARRLCPRGIFVPNRRAVYVDFSRKIFAVLRQYSPKVHAISIDEGLLDLTGTEKLFGAPALTARKILARLEKELGLEASGGLARTPMVAKIAATLAKPHGFIEVRPGSEEEFLGSLSVEAIPGIGPKTTQILSRLGVRTIGQLLRSPELRKQHLDLDGEGDLPRREEHSISSETTMERPLEKLEEMEAVLLERVEEVSARLRAENYYARCVTVKIRYASFKTIVRSCTLFYPTRFDHEIFAASRGLLRRHLAAAQAVRLLGVKLSSLVAVGWQEPLFDVQKRRSWENLYRGIDSLRKKYGDRAIFPAASRARARQA